MKKKSYKDTLNINESYFVNRIDKGNNLEIIFMSHNKHWPYIEKKKMSYNNAGVQVGVKSSLINNLAILVGEEVDLLTFYVRDYDESEYLDLKTLAYKISKERSKAVTIGYSYLSHDNKYNIIVAKVVNGLESEEMITDIAYLSQMDLIAYTLLKHENIVHRKYRERVNYK